MDSLFGHLGIFSAAPKRAVLSISSLLIAGTGSMFPIETAAQWQPLIEHRCPWLFEKPTPSKSDIDVRTPKEHLENIRATLNPPISQLAILFEVSRQAIYKWLAQDAHPEVQNLDRIKTLSRIADVFRDAGILRAGTLLNMQNEKGVSLFDLLKTNAPFEEHLKMLLAEAQIMEASYQRSGLAQ